MSRKLTITTLIENEALQMIDSAQRRPFGESELDDILSGTAENHPRDEDDYVLEIDDGFVAVYFQGYKDDVLYACLLVSIDTKTVMAGLEDLTEIAELFGAPDDIDLKAMAEYVEGVQGASDWVHIDELTDEVLMLWPADVSGSSSSSSSQVELPVVQQCYTIENTAASITLENVVETIAGEMWTATTLTIIGMKVTGLGVATKFQAETGVTIRQLDATAYQISILGGGPSDAAVIDGTEYTVGSCSINYETSPAENDPSPGPGTWGPEAISLAPIGFDLTISIVCVSVGPQTPIETPQTPPLPRP